jgi:hypothetical protein
VIARVQTENVDALGKLVVSRIHLVGVVTRTLTCPIVKVTGGTANPPSIPGAPPTTGIDGGPPARVRSRPLGSEAGRYHQWTGCRGRPRSSRRPLLDQTLRANLRDEAELLPTRRQS